MNNAISRSQLYDAIATIEQKSGVIVDLNKLSNAVPEKWIRFPTLSKPKSLNGGILIKESVYCTTIICKNFEFNETFTYTIKTNNNKSIFKRYVRSFDVTSAFEVIEPSLVEKNILHINKFNSLPLCLDGHPYTKQKQIVRLNCYELRSDGNKLCIPFYNSDKYLCGYQTINSIGEKRFMGSYGGCFYKYPKENPDASLYTQKNSFFILGEGFATTMSAHEAVDFYFDSRLFICYGLVILNS
jgi:hypothetical protein